MKKKIFKKSFRKFNVNVPFKSQMMILEAIYAIKQLLIDH